MIALVLDLVEAGLGRVVELELELVVMSFMVITRCWPTRCELEAAVTQSFGLLMP